MIQLREALFKTPQSASNIRLIDSAGFETKGHLTDVAADGLSATFTVSELGIESDHLVPSGSYTLEADRLLQTVTIAANQESGAFYPNWSVYAGSGVSATQDFAFDVYEPNAFLSSVDLKGTNNDGGDSGTFEGVTAQFRAGTVDQPPFGGFAGAGVQSIPGGTIAPTVLKQTAAAQTAVIAAGGSARDNASAVAHAVGIVPTEIIGVSATAGFKLSLEQA